MSRGGHKHKTQPAPAPFKAGDSVRVRAGVKDPDLDLPISSWQGRVTVIEEYMVDIAWDSPTLQAMPAKMIDWCEEEGLDWSMMRLGVAEVESAEPRDTPAATARAKRNLAAQHAYAYLGEEGQRIQKVLAGIDPDDEMKALKAWRKHLKAALTFPFESEVAEHGGPFRVGEKVRVTGLSDVIDDGYGLIAELGARHAGSAYPLCDLEVTRKSPNQLLVHDYAVWFANR